MYGISGLTLYYMRDNLLWQSSWHRRLKRFLMNCSRSGFLLKRLFRFDSLSMAENNSSCFNYRTIAGRKKLSDHAFGRAIDINPMQNPYNQQNKAIHPRNAIYDPLAKGTLIKDSAAVTVFLKRGWNWGGNPPRGWKSWCRTPSAKCPPDAPTGVPSGRGRQLEVL